MWKDVCGAPDKGQVAAVTRTKDMWDKYHMTDYMLNTVKSYQDKQWDGSKSMQKIFLREAGNQGAEKCDEVTDARCIGTGLDYNLCKSHPTAHFVWFAMVNFAHYLNKFHETLQNNHAMLDSLSSALVKQFYTTRADPSATLIVPFSIVGGLGAIISAAWPGGAIIAGLASIATAVATQAALDRPDPLKQWQGVLSAIGNLFKQIATVLEEYFQDNLNKLPAADANPTFLDDPGALPHVLGTGGFATTPFVGSFNKGVQPGFGAVSINSLWLQDSVLIIKISDEAYGKGAGEACKAYPEQTVCRDGVAHIFVRWVLDGGIARHGISNYARGAAFKDEEWNVFGAYARGKAGDGTENADHLKDFGITLGQILDSSMETQAQRGFLYQDQNQDTLD